MKNGQFALAEMTFGAEDDALVISEWEAGVASVRSEDTPNPVGDGLLFGRDRLDGPLWRLEWWTNAESGAESSLLLGKLGAVWRRGVALPPGAVMPLRYAVHGRVRRVYGRPRTLTPITPDEHMEQGVGAAIGDFQCADHLHYDDTARSLTLRLVTQSTGGWVWGEATWPIQTVSGGTRQGVIDDVGGDAPAPFEVTFKGPISAPWAAGPGWRVEMPKLVLAYDQSVTVSTYPWALTARRNDGADMSGLLSWGTRLLGARIKPGASEFTFGGVDATNTATCTLSWRPAWVSL